MTDSAQAADRARAIARAGSFEAALASGALPRRIDVTIRRRALELTAGLERIAAHSGKPRRATACK